MIKIPLYNIKVTIRIFKSCDDLKKGFKKYAKKYSIEEDGEDDIYLARTVVGSNEQAYLLFIEDKVDINTITHEVYHLTNRILVNQGVTLDPYDDENFAILNGFLNQEVIKYLRKKKIKINDLVEPLKKQQPETLTDNNTTDGGIREQQAD